MSEEYHEFSVVKTIRIGFAFFIASLFWPIYNSYVPLFLDYFYEKQLPKNFIMSIDNFFALSVIPLFAFLSDRTLSRFGRRKPYIFIGTIVSAVLYAIFPNVRTVLPLFLLVLFAVNFSMASFRGPAVSLMPDLVPAEDRSKGNGIVTLMAGLAGLLVFLTGAFFYAKDPAYPFYYVSALMILSLIPLIGIKEPSLLLYELPSNPRPPAARRYHRRNRLFDHVFLRRHWTWSGNVGCDFPAPLRGA